MADPAPYNLRSAIRPEENGEHPHDREQHIQHDMPEDTECRELMELEDQQGHLQEGDQPSIIEKPQKKHHVSEHGDISQGRTSHTEELKITENYDGSSPVSKWPHSEEISLGKQKQHGERTSTLGFESTERDQPVRFTISPPRYPLSTDRNGMDSHSEHNPCVLERKGVNSIRRDSVDMISERPQRLPRTGTERRAEANVRQNDPEGIRHDGFRGWMHLEGAEQNRNQRRNRIGQAGAIGLADYAIPNSEPRPRLPTFDGKGDWRSFLIKFSLLVDRYGWDEATELGHLISCLQDDAMFYVSRLDSQTRSSLNSLMNALERRFGDHVLPETHRASLQALRKKPQETLQEYAARTQTLISRAYPGLEGTELFTSMTIDHLISGLQDPNLVYDVKTKRPSTLQEALDMITWHECCKGNTNRRANIRKITDTDNDIRRTSGQRYVTEERLQDFGRDLKESLVHSVKEAVKNQVTNLMSGQQAGHMNAANDRMWRNLEGTGHTWGKGRCFNCRETGHFAHECPLVKPGAKESGGDSKRESGGICLN